MMGIGRCLLSVAMQVCLARFLSIPVALQDPALHDNMQFLIGRQIGQGYAWRIVRHQIYYLQDYSPH